MGEIVKKAGLEGYAIVQHGEEHMAGIMEENLGGQQITAADFDRVKWPSGGARFFEVPGVGGEPEAAQDIEGVIVFHRNVRTYWAEAYSGDGTPPDCYSENCNSGVGNPGGFCTDCHMSQFGSAVGPDGEPRKGQACAEKKVLFILRKNELLPIVISLPPTSLRAVKKYMMGLLSRGTPYYGVVTKLGVKKESNDSAEFSVATLGASEVLSPDGMARIEAYRNGIVGYLKATRVASEEVNDEGT